MSDNELVPGTRMIDDKGVTMVYAPTGKFLMGSTQQQVDDAYEIAVEHYGDKANKDWYTRELPQHDMTITQPYWLDLTPVTNAAYAEFVKDNGYQTREMWTPDGWQWIQSNKNHVPTDYAGFTDADQPRVGVTWYEAAAYCQWRGGRLPTEAEWEWAARGEKNLLYAWGNQYDLDKVVWSKNSGGKAARVGSKLGGASWVGTLDMCGNVWEWVQTIFDQAQYPYPSQENDGRNTVNGASIRILRGGSWNSGNSSFLRTADRGWETPVVVNDDVGFRTARSL